jgi:hypothetical protein
MTDYETALSSANICDYLAVPDNAMERGGRGLHDEARH